MRGRNVSALLVVLVVLSSFSVLVTILPENVKAKTLFVGGGGPGNFTKIQDAVDFANPGDSVFVYSGTYVEQILISKTLSLVGEDRSSTIIDGNQWGSVGVNADWVSVSGFTITNGGSAGIKLYSVHNTSIDNNIISFSRDGPGIFLSFSNHTTITNNVMVDLGIYIEGDVPEHWNSHTIDTSNTVNGKPVYYWRDVRGGLVLPGAGQVILVNCTWVTIENQDLDGGSAGVTLAYSKANTIANNTASGNDLVGILLYSSNDNSITNNTVSDIRSVGIELGKGVKLVLSNRNIISDNDIRNSERAVWIDSSDHNAFVNNNLSDNIAGFSGSGFGNLIANNSVTNCSGGITLYGYNNRVENNTVLVRNTGIRFYRSEATTLVNNVVLNGDIGISVTESSNSTISNNNISGNRIGITLYLSNNISITHNILHLNTEEGIMMVSTGNSTLSNNSMMRNSIAIGGVAINHWNTHVIDITNTVNGKPVQYWKNATGGVVPPGAGEVILANCTGVVVEHQNISDATIGIQVGFSYDSVIANNTASFHRSAGLAIYVGIRTAIANNNFSSNDEDGIASVYGIFNVIFNNTILLNRNHGVHLHDSHANVIVNNDISLNDERGLDFAGSDGQLIANNTLYLNKHTGMEATSVISYIFHNNFVANTRQAYDRGSTNHWDDGYPSGGNYWDDYTGSDLLSGPLQNLPGSDGIGDTPYVIEGDTSTDRYPLMSLCGVLLPRAPIVLDATLTGMDHENVTVNWSLSPDDGKGFKTIASYRIYRNMTYDPNGLGYMPVGSVSKGTPHFTDVQAGEGDPNTYFYRVCAVDLGNNIMCAQTQAAKFTRPLTMGTNLVSVPLIQSDDWIRTVFQTVEWNEAWAFNASSRNWDWHMKLKPYLGELNSVSLNQGIWINSPRSSNLTVAGIVPLQIQIDLKAGWNLVGFPSFKTTFTVSDLKLETGATRVEGYDLTSPPYLLRVLQDSDVLSAGQGYWIDVPGGISWTVSNI